MAIEEYLVVEARIEMEETFARINALRAFRHVYRNVYGFYLDPDKVTLQLKSLATTLSGLRANLTRFETEMRRLLDLASPDRGH